MILAGDIGGTKTVLALCEVAPGHPARAAAAAAATSSGPPAAPSSASPASSEATALPIASAAGFTILRETIYHCADFPSLEAILDQFLPPGAPHGIVAACFGVAGPVVNGIAKITNLPWTIDAAAVAGKLRAPVALLNDLQATALGALVLPPAAFAVLQPPAAAPPLGATIAVIAPGTGLGESLLVSDGLRYRALPSEGGHADFAPGSDDEIALLRYLRGVHGPHVSYERVLSGAGIGALYDFARSTAGAEPAWLTAELAAGDRNAAVSQIALAGRDPTCVRALDMFVDILGAEAGNLALRGLATGGVVIGGGIPPKILPALQQPRFLERFTAKGRFAAWTRSLGVRVTLEPRAALFGAAHHAATHKDGV
jgi:glucokinase